MTYLEALDFLVKASGWKRKDVIDDGESAGWFVAQRAKTDDAKEEAHRMGVIVARGKE